MAQQQTRKSVVPYIAKQATVEEMLEKHNFSHCNNVRSPYRPGLKTNQIEHDGKDLSTREKNQLLVV